MNLTFLKSEVQAPGLSAPYLKLYNTGKNNSFQFSLGAFSQKISHLSQCLRSRKEVMVSAFWECQCSIYFFSAGANWWWRIFPQRLGLYVPFYIHWSSLILLLCQSNLPHYKSVKEVICSVHEWNSELWWNCLCRLECSLFSWQLPHVCFACKGKEWGR